MISISYEKSGFTTRNRKELACKYVHTGEHIDMNALEKYRQETGHTYQQIADMAGLKTKSTVFQHCHAVRQISDKCALKYHQGLGIPLSELRPDLWPPAGEEVDA